MAKKLLLADDSVTIQKVVGISFANEDIELVAVDNGDDALASARQACPDLVLADIVMPGKNGYELCEAMKSDPELAHVPVLLMTGTFEAFDEERAARCGAAGHIAKPFEAQALVDRVHELLSAAAAPPAAAAPDSTATVAIGRLEVDKPAAAVDAADSFDFFDDALRDAPAPMATTAPAATAPAATNLDLESESSAFAFGEASPAQEDPLPEAQATSLAHAVGADSRVEPPVASRPDMNTADPLAGTELVSPELPPAAPAAPDLANGLDTTSAPSAETLAGLLSPASEPPDLLDIESAGDLAGGSLTQETQLDPQGASGYDVSGSALAGDTAPSEADDLLWGEPNSALPPVGGTTPDPSEPQTLGKMAQGVVEASAGDTLDAASVATLMDESSLEEVAFAEPASDFAIGEPPPAVASVVDDGLADLPEFAPPPAAGVAQDDPRRVSTSHDPAALAGIAMAQVEPQLREQIHDTLEKIAWESLGSVTDQIISQAVERIERAAWEVIPEMAETLIREEIRRMKGE